MFMEKIGKKTQRRSDAFLPKSLQVSKIFPIFAPKIEDNMEQQTDIRWIQRYAKLSQDQNYQQV
jgi:hypothetical protein